MDRKENNIMIVYGLNGYENGMLQKRNILPKGLGDVGATSFFIIGVPFGYWYELTFVLPYFHAPESFWYYFHFSCITYLFVNIVSAFVGTVMTDTSIRQRFIPRADDTKICATCESLSPPRAYHCPLCQICILKHDHHCVFTSCCIGYFNHRYFLSLILYVFVSSIYAIFYNSVYVYETYEFRDLQALFAVIVPVVALVFGQMNGHHCIVVLLLNIVILVFMIVLLKIHIRLLLTGKLTHENKYNINKYNLGWKRNIMEVFGERWYIAWISPFIRSKLPGDGISFRRIDESVKIKYI